MANVNTYKHNILHDETCKFNFRTTKHIMHPTRKIGRRREPNLLRCYFRFEEDR